MNFLYIRSLRRHLREDHEIPEQEVKQVVDKEKAKIPEYGLNVLITAIIAISDVFLR